VSDRKPLPWWEGLGRGRGKEVAEYPDGC